jgi:hypothetical protein
MMRRVRSSSTVCARRHSGRDHCAQRSPPFVSSVAAPDRIRLGVGLIPSVHRALFTSLCSSCVSSSAMTSSSSIGVDYLESRHRSVVVHAHAVDYDDIIRLFTHRHTSTLFKRQAAAFRQIAREKKDGLAMSDLDPVCRVIQLGLERIDESARRTSRLAQPCAK